MRRFLVSPSDPRWCIGGSLDSGSNEIEAPATSEIDPGKYVSMFPDYPELPPGKSPVANRGGQAIHEQFQKWYDEWAFSK